MPQLIGVFIALLVGIAVGRDAKTRGMSPWGWGIFVFLILIIGLPAYFIARKPKLETQETSEVVSEPASEPVSEVASEPTSEETTEESGEETTEEKS